MIKNTLNNKEVQTKPYQPLAWVATAVLLLAATTLSALDNQVYATYGFGIASTIWTVVGILWKEKSLIVLNGVLTIIYLVGIFKHLYGVIGQ